MRAIYRSIREIFYLLSSKAQGKGYVLMMHHILHEGEDGMPENKSLNIQPSELEQFIIHAKDKYDFIPLDDIPSRLRSHNKRKFLVFTMDDGYKSVFTNGYPIFRKYDVPFTVFVTSGFISGCIKLDNEESMNWIQINQIANDPLCTIGGHTVTHPRMTTLSNRELEKEVGQCMEDIACNIGKTINCFAYPYGDQDERVTDFVISKNIESTFLAISGVVTNQDVSMRNIPRINFSKDISVKDLRHWRNTYMGII